MEDSKTCTKCAETKPIDQFFRDASRRDGLTVRCKECHRSDAKRYREKESFKIKAAERSKRYRDAHPDRVKAYVERNKDRAADRLIKWRKNNPEKVSAQSLRRMPKQLIYYKRQRDQISDYYITHYLHVPVELAQLKREQLRIFRATKQLIQLIKEKTNGNQ